MRPRRLAPLAATLLLLGGCALFECRADRAMHKTPEYKLGYSDGCASAGAEGTDMRHGSMVRDDALYDSNKAYRAGWRTGMSACRSTANPGDNTGNALPDIRPGGSQLPMNR
jgi:hypothetical protein